MTWTTGLMLAAALANGSYVANENHRCTELDFLALRSDELFMAEESLIGSCPFEGRYYSSPERTGCQLRISAGCRNRSHLEITSTCQFRPGIDFIQCETFAQWPKGSLSSLGTLPTMRQNELTTDIVQDRSCSQDFYNFTSSQAEVYSFQSFLDECPLEIVQVQPEIAIIKTISDVDKPLPEHGYSHVSREDISKSKELHIRSSDASSTIFQSKRHFNHLLMTVYLLIQSTASPLLR